MGKKILFLLVCALMSVNMVFAQTRQVTGTVIDSETGEPLIGAQVKVEGTTIGALTDLDGKFTLRNLPRSAEQVVVSYMGMNTVKAYIKPHMAITLTANAQDMNEVMVVAYGTQTKSSFTGSASIVGADEIAKVQVTNAVDALRGKAAGVQIYNSSGQPGGTPSIRIRGFNSLVAGQAPLLVVDGSPFDGTLNDINPTDVESMTVLKDAASTALYGARGGNGVILITTKNGARNKDAQVTLEAKWGSNMRGDRNYDVINNPAGYYETYYQGLYNYASNQLGMNPSSSWNWANANLINRDNGFGLGYNVYSGIPDGQGMIGTNGKLNPVATLGNVVTGADGNPYMLIPDNWDKEIYHNGMRQQYTFSANGGSDKGSYYVSADYLSNEGITYASDYERFTARMKADYMLKKWLKFTGNLSYSHADQNSLGNEGAANAGNIFALRNIAPIYPVFMRDGNGQILTHQASGIPAYDYADPTSGLGISRPYLGQSNPISDLLVDKSYNDRNTFNGTGQFDIYLPLNITFTSLNNIYLTEARGTSVTNPYFGQYASSNGMVSKGHDRNLNTNFQQRLNWSEKFGAHGIEVMAAHEYYMARAYELSGNKHNMFSMDNDELDGAVIVDGTGSSRSEYNTESWLARAMYDYDQRYYVHASGMRQASSAFHPDHRWGTFWSASAGWMMSKEDWFKASWVDELKIKASAGQNGNDNSLNGYYYTNRWYVVNSNNSVSLSPSTQGKNEEFSWEKSTKFNAGVDFSLFKDRLWGSVEYYNNHTSDLISSVPYAPSFGYTNFYDNVGNMRNHGVEIDLHGTIIRNKDFKWDIYANITSNSNEITKLHDSRKSTSLYSYDPETGKVEGVLGYTSGNYIYAEGSSRYSYWCKKFAGIYSEDTYKSTYAPGTKEADMVYDPSKAGMALYYKNHYVTDADGNRVQDANGVNMVDGVYTTVTATEAESYNCGDVLPDFYGGFGTSLSYKGFDLSADFQYQIGGKVYDSEYNSLMGFSDGYGYHKDLLNAWTPTNTKTDIPRLNVGDSYHAYTSDRFLTNASYLNVANITLGYSFPKSILSKLYLSKLRIYAVGDNLITMSKRKGLNPRQSVTGGSSSLYYASMRTISAGVQIGF